MNSFSWYWLRKELKRRQVWILGLLITLGISGLVFVDLFSQRLSETASLNARNFLGADYQVSSWRELEDDVFQKITKLVGKDNWLRQKSLIASMQGADKQITAINLAAVEAPYPFYGNWETLQNLKISDLKERELFIDQAAQSKGYKVGDTLRIGEEYFTIRDFVTKEPRAISFFRAGQYKVWIPHNSLKVTGLSGEGSRVRNRVFLKAPEEEAKEFRKKFRALIDSPSIRLRSAAQSNAQAQKTVSVLRSYLSFISLCSTLLGIVGLFFLFIRDLEKRLPTYLTLRCLGLSDRSILLSSSIPVLLSAVLGATIGFLLGSWGETLLTQYAAAKIDLSFASPKSYLSSYLLALATSLLALIPVIYFPIKALLKTPTQILFSGLSSGSSLSTSFDKKAIATCLFFTFSLSLLTTKSLPLSLFGFICVIMGLGLLALLLWILIKGLKKITVNTCLKGFSVFYLIRAFTQKTSQTFVWILSIAFSLFFLNLGVILATSIYQQINVASNGIAPNLLTLGLTQEDYQNKKEIFPKKTEWIPYLQSRIFEVDGTPIREMAREKNENIDSEGNQGYQFREHFINVRNTQKLFPGEKPSKRSLTFCAECPVK